MNNESLVILKSVTFAMKAKRILLSNGIKSYIVKPDPKLTEKGCSYALSLNILDLPVALSIIEKNNLPIVRVIQV